MAETFISNAITTMEKDLLSAQGIWESIDEENDIVDFFKQAYAVYNGYEMINLYYADPDVLKKHIALVQTTGNSIISTYQSDDYSSEDKKRIIAQIVKFNLILINRSLNFYATETIMPDFPKMLRYQYINVLTEETIKKMYGMVEPFTSIFVDYWKKSIEQEHKKSPYRNYKDKGKKLWMDLYAEYIRQYEPNYIMPEFKQNGVICFGERANCKQRF